MGVASTQATLVVDIATAASGFDDVAEAEAVMNEIGVQQFDRYASFSTRDYNGLAADLAGRDWTQGKVLTAYEKARIGMIASFDSFKLDYANILDAATATTVTIDGASQYYTPVATSTAATGETSNVDNRYQTITVAVTSGTIAVGDCFTIAGVNSVHMITKQDTGQLKTFRVIEIVSGAGGSGDIKISPPIISAEGTTDAEYQYQNVTATPADTAAVTFLNIADAYQNPFWQKDALEILPGRYAIPTNAGAAIMKATTEQGIDLVMQKQYDINTTNTKYRLDTKFGVVCKQPEMCGIILFGQT
jgi:hypothetical protein